MSETGIETIAMGILLISAFFAGGCTEKDAGTSPKTGILEVNVAIGPLCPVEPCEISDAQKSEAYSVRTIQIYTENRKSLLEELSPGPDGHIKTELEAGEYIVDMKPSGIDSTTDLPAEIRILPGETVYLEVSIDTGIR